MKLSSRLFISNGSQVSDWAETFMEFNWAMSGHCSALKSFSWGHGWVLHSSESSPGPSHGRPPLAGLQKNNFKNLIIFFKHLRTVDCRRCEYGIGLRRHRSVSRRSMDPTPPTIHRADFWPPDQHFSSAFRSIHKILWCTTFRLK